MATGLEVLGAVAASLEIFKVAKSCLFLFNEARNINLQNRQHKDAHLNLVVQGLRFERWCSSLGISDLIQLQELRTESQRTDKGIEWLEERLSADINLQNAAFQQLALRALQGLEERFKEATVILNRHFQGEDSFSSPPTSEKSSQGFRSLNKTWSKLVRKGSPVPSSASSKSSENFARTSSPGFSSVYLSARWVSRDKNALFELLGDIEKTNDLLLELLPSSLRLQVSRRAELTILNESLEDTLNLPQGSDLKALASIKNWQLIYSDNTQNQGAFLSHSISSTNTMPIKSQYRGYNIQDFKRGTLKHGEHRSLSVLNSQDVMVEWKYYSKGHPMLMEQITRLSGLVSLLNTNELHDRFSTLPCSGLVNDTDNSRIGIIFRIPPMDQTKILMKDLQTAIFEIETAPPMGQRFELARTLATAIHHLHSVNWFHKSMRCDNVVSIWPADKILDPGKTLTKALSQLEVKTKPLQAGEISQPADPLPTFFLVGWDLSRPDHPSELSETLSVSTVGFQSRRDAIEMYSYPGTNIKLKSGRRQRYRAEYDFYSLGIILLEIGLWRPVSTIRASCSDDADFRLRLCTEYCDRLLSRMGVIYWRVVQRCINNDFLPGSEHDLGDSYALQAAFEKHVVSELERCSA